MGLSEGNTGVASKGGGGLAKLLSSKKKRGRRGGWLSYIQGSIT